VRVLITGCKGQVGYCLAEKLAGQVELLALDSEQLDITDAVAVDKTVAEFKPDFILNAAAYTAVDRAEEEKELAYAVNSEGPRNLARSAHLHDSVLLHLSTDYVFDGEGDSAYLENHTPNPQSVYGASKLAGEIAVAEECNQHLIVRTAWVFGEHGNNFVKTMLRLGLSHNQLSIVGDQYGSPTYAGDIADALITMMLHVASGKQTAWGVFHFSGTPYVSWFQFAQRIFDAAKSNVVLTQTPSLKSITTAEYPTPAKRPANSRLNCEKVQSQFDIKPSDWQKALTNISAYK